MRRFTLREHAALVRIYLRDYPKLESFPALSQEEVAAWQLAALRGLIQLAYERSGFYRKLYTGYGIEPGDIRSWEDFRRLPTVTKDEILAHREEVLVDEGGRLRLVRSSGSTGQMLEIYADTQRLISAALLMLRMYRGSHRFSPWEKGALIYASRYPYQRSHAPYGLHYIHTLTPPGQILNQLTRLHPTYIISYPSILLELAALDARRCRELKVRALFTNSEHSSQAQRDTLAEVFGAAVFDEYSTEELCLGAFQCRHGLYHLQEDCAYLEVLHVEDDGQALAGQVGEIVGTCLINRAMPFIRYRQGDLGGITTASCGCGLDGRVLADLSGRKNASFRLPDGTQLPSGRILDWTYALVLSLTLPIAQFQVIQHAVDRVEVVVVGSPAYRHDECAPVIAESFRAEFGAFFQVTVTPADFIPRTPVGKHIPIRSLLHTPARRISNSSEHGDRTG